MEDNDAMAGWVWQLVARHMLLELTVALVSGRRGFS